MIGQQLDITETCPEAGLINELPLEDMQRAVEYTTLHKRQLETGLKGDDLARLRALRSHFGARDGLASGGIAKLARGGANVCGLSPEAEKRCFEAMGRERGYWSRLARTTKLAVVMRPRSGSRRGFARWIAANLPACAFDSKHNYWTTHLDELERVYQTLAPNVTLSDGAREYLGVA